VPNQGPRYDPNMRGATAIFAVLLVITAVGVFTWMTHHPDATILEDAESWPLVGPLAERFRAAYLHEGSPSPPTNGGEGGVVYEYEILSEASEGKGTPDGEGGAEGLSPGSPPTGPRGVAPFVWVRAGAELRARNEPSARIVHEYAEPERLAVIESRGDWYRVRPHDRSENTVGESERIGWVHLPGYSELSNPPFGSEPRRLGPLDSQGPESELLAAARGLLDGERILNAGPYTLYSDAEDEELFAWLDRVVKNLEPTYRQRYDLEPRGAPREVIILFRDEAQYRKLQARTMSGTSIAPGDRRVEGHAFQGLAATWIGRRPRAIVGGVVVHELVHLLNRRAIGPSLPGWLDEGLAEDIALSELTPEGDILVDRLGGSRQHVGVRTVLSRGGVGSALYLQREHRANRALDLERFVTTDWELLRDERDLYYATAGLYFRYLQRSGSTEARELRHFLVSVANGEPADGQELLRAIADDLAAHEEAFSRWVLDLKP